MIELVHDIAGALGLNVSGATELTPGGNRRMLRIDCPGRSLFVKLLPADRTDAFQSEASGLELLRDADTFRVPQVYGYGNVGDLAWLALEWLDLRPVSTAEDGRIFGQALAALHARHGELYGLDHDNWLGDCPQQNGYFSSWPQFYARRRIEPLLHMLMAGGERGGLIGDLQSIVERLPALFLDYRPVPSLLHGDLWHGNAGMVDARPAVFDPAVHFGDRESDYAMTELFGGFPLAMYAAYQQYSPLDAGAASRRKLYRLRHLLNHLVLFGQSYRRETERTAAHLLSELR